MSESIEDVANRVLAHAYALQGKADQAFRDWEHKPTLSNAIRRDDTKKDAALCGDMISLSRAVLAQAATDRARSK